MPGRDPSNEHYGSCGALSEEFRVTAEQLGGAGLCIPHRCYHTRLDDMRRQELD